MSKALVLLDEFIDELTELTKSSCNIPEIPQIIENENSNKEDKKEKPKKEVIKREKAPEPPKITAEDLNINHLDLRVGVITSVTKHETADKLYCEEIDIGETEVRQIASGLVNHYTLEEMKNRRLIVIANLSPRKLVGFKSNGMVLCAAQEISEGNEKVEFVDPPLNAIPGARIVGEGLIGDPLTPKQIDKLKAFELLAQGLKTDSNGNATWNGIRLVVEGTNDGLTTPTLRDALLR